MVGSDLTQTPSVSRLLQTPENHRKGFLFILFCIDFFRIEIRREGLAMPLVPLEEKFWAKVEKTETCWLWTAGKNGTGYGVIKHGADHWTAHRLSYTWARGPIPDGLELDHLCRVRECVNPDHMEPVTHLENVRRGHAGLRFRERNKCSKGHEYTPETTYRSLKDGSRVCRTCMRAAQIAWRLKQREHLKLVGDATLA